MKTVFKQIAVGMTALTLAFGAVASDKGTAEEAMAMVKKGVALIKSSG